MRAGKFSITTARPMELVDITATISGKLQESGIRFGICTLFNPHTTAGLTINEGADPAVGHDIIGGLKKIVPMDYPYTHMEGNSPSHIMASLMGCSLTILIENQKLILGTWQKIFFCEFDGPRTRSIHWQIEASD